MPDARITELASQTGASVDTLDPLVIVDLSDTSMAATGTDKKITAGEFAIAVQALLNLAVASDLVVLAPADSARNVIEPTADAIALILKAFAGQTEPLEVWQDENGNAVVSVWADSGPGGGHSTRVLINHAVSGFSTYVDENVFYDPPTRNQVQFDFFASDPDDGNRSGELFYLAFADAIVPGILNSFGLSSADHGAFVEANSGGSGGIALLVAVDLATQTMLRAATGQTLPLLRLQDDNHADVVRAMPNGAVISNAHAAPDDSDLNNSDFATWLDDTPGATALHVKAKDALGAVYTATIPMTAS